MTSVSNTECEYTPPITLGDGCFEIDTTPDGEGDLEVCSRDGDHVAYLDPTDQLTLRDLLNRLHPPKQVTTAEELDALPNESIILDAMSQCRESAKLTDGSNVWRAIGPAQVKFSTEIALPATVLHIGSVNA